jgi:hypothetical protein
MMHYILRIPVLLNYQHAVFLIDIDSHFIREEAIANLLAPVLLVQAQVGPMDEHEDLLA